MIGFSNRGWEDYIYWQSTDKAQVKRINALVKDMLRHPFEGIGQPEALKHERFNCANASLLEHTGYWSRRIDQEHRLVYKVTDSIIIIAQCRYHY